MPQKHISDSLTINNRKHRWWRFYFRLH